MPRSIPPGDRIPAILLLAALTAGCTGEKPAGTPPPGATEQPAVPATATPPPEPGADGAAPPVPDAAIDTKAVSRPLASPRNDVAGAANLAQISPALWRSAQPTAEGFRNLKKLGIRTVVNLRNISSDRSSLQGLGLRYCHIHFAPWHAEDEDVVKFLKVMADPANHPVLVHCQHGADRTGTMVAIYRVVEQGWAMEEAMQELPRFGFHSIWANLKKYLRELDPDAIRAKAAKAAMPKVEVVP